MNEKPLEWMTDCGESLPHKIGRLACLAVAVLMFVLSVMTWKGLFLLIMLVFIGLFAWLQTHAFIEYEFSYFADEMEIAAVYNKSSRKQKMSFQAEDIEYMVKRVDQQQTMKYFCPKDMLQQAYTIVVNKDGKRMGIVMEADPAFVKEMEIRRKVR